MDVPFSSPFDQVYAIALSPTGELDVAGDTGSGPNTGGDFAVARYSTGPQRTYVLQDANYNVTAVMDKSGAAAIDRFVYDSYGAQTALDANWNVRPGNSSQSGMATGFQGMAYDGIDRTYHTLNREYSPVLGRWEGEDPAGYTDGLNLSQLEKDSPNQYVDSLGLKAERPKSGKDLTSHGFGEQSIDGNNGTWYIYEKEIDKESTTRNKLTPASGVEIRVFYIPNNLKDCEQVDILQFSRAYELADDGSVRKIRTDLRDDPELKTTKGGWAVDAPPAGGSGYYTSNTSVGGRPWKAGDSKFPDALVKDSPYDPDMDNSLRFEFYDVAVVTKGSRAGQFLDTIRWSFDRKKGGGIESSRGYEPKEYAKPAKTPFNEAKKAIDNWNDAHSNMRVNAHL